MANGNPQAAGAAAPAPVVLEAFGHKIEASKLPAPAISALLEAGFSYLLRSAKPAKSAVEGKSEDEVAKLVAGAREARFKAILSGEKIKRAGSGEGKASPLQKMMHQIAVERLKVLVASADAKAPKGDVRKEAIRRILERQEADIRAAAEARLIENKKASEGLSELFS